MGSANTVRVVSWAFPQCIPELEAVALFFSPRPTLELCDSSPLLSLPLWLASPSVCLQDTPMQRRVDTMLAERRRCFVTAERDTKAVYPTRTKCSDNYCSYLSSEMGVWTTRVPSTQHEQRRATNRVRSRVQMITTNLLLLPNVVVSNGNLPQA